MIAALKKLLKPRSSASALSVETEGPEPETEDGSTPSLGDVTRSPFANKPPTWPLNPAFLSIIDRCEAMWRDKGYAWSFGIEHEFHLIPMADFQKVKIDEMKPIYREYTKQIKNESGDVLRNAKPLNHLEERISDYIATLTSDTSRHFGWSHEKAVKCY